MVDLNTIFTHPLQEPDLSRTSEIGGGSVSLKRPSPLYHSVRNMVASQCDFDYDTIMNTRGEGAGRCVSDTIDQWPS